MALIDYILNVYKMQAHCKNCDAFMTMRIPRGIKAETYFKSDTARCYECGCATLELDGDDEDIIDVTDIIHGDKPVKRNHKQKRDNEPERSN